MIQAHFLPKQLCDTWFISKPLTIPMFHIYKNECNLKNNIDSNQNIIQTQHNVAHIHEYNGRYLLTIP